MILSNAAKAYTNVGLESGVQAVSPAKLVLMLYDGALMAIRDAKAHMAAGRVSEKGMAVSRAIAIIDGGLDPAIDTARGGVIAQSLHKLYDYMCRRLAVANMQNDPAGLEQVSALLGDLRDAWSEIAAKPVAAAPAVAAPAPVPVSVSMPAPAADMPRPRPAPVSRVHAAYYATP